MTAATLEAPITITAAAPPDSAARRRWLGYSAVVAATVLNLLDSTVVSVGAPAIQADLGGSYASLQWMSAGYTLALAVLLLVGGRLGDMVGRKRMLLAGVAGFTVTSLLCAAAVTPEMLVGSRVLQGAFGAMMLPQGFGLIRDLFPPAEMGKAFAIFGPLMGLGAVLGPIVGGTLLDANVFGTGWRMLFLVNLPVGIAALVLAARHLPSVAPSAAGSRLDLPAVAYAGIGMFLLIFPLVQGNELG